MDSSFPNTNALWSGVIVETLRRKGLATAIVCPGSRSSPLAFAFAQSSQIEALSVLDERSAAFHALGIAKATGKLVALVCTSGSALANFYPAVVEASELGIPLVLLTADRPPELRHCSAGQTIDQTKFYGEYVRSSIELSLPDADLSKLKYLRQTLSHVSDCSLAQCRGPVHINVPFREPLVPVLEDSFKSPFSQEQFESFFGGIEKSISVKFACSDALQTFCNSERGLILVGPNSPVCVESWIDSVSKISNSLNWPVFADGLNPVRSRSPQFENLVAGYEFILRSSELKNELKPERVLVIGELPTCKALREWLSEIDCPMCVVSDRIKNLDATHSKSRAVFCNLEQDTLEVSQQSQSGYTARWIELDDQVSSLLDSKMNALEDGFEGKLSWSLGRSLPDGAVLSVSNSMPPRDLEFYFPKCEKQLRVFSSRGANGIDGILSTALGVARSSPDTSNYLLIGDLALLHDSNGALLSRDFESNLTILLVNNSGGGIFEMLPVSKFGKTFEEFWVTDQKVNFEDWAKTYGILHSVVENWNQALKDRISKGVRILEFKTNGKEDANTRKKWFSEISNSLR